MFCSLRKIYLENHFFATAYASSAYELDADHHMTILPGAIIGIRKSALDLDPEFSVWATWKDQLNFTSIAKDLESPLEYPRFTVSDQNPWFLRYVITHEFGHLFDFANHLDQITPLDESCDQIQDPDEFAKKCPYQFIENTWGALAWNNFRQVKPEFDFYNRSLLCFYSCKNHMSPENGRTSARRTPGRRRWRASLPSAVRRWQPLVAGRAGVSQSGPRARARNRRSG